jgi:phosphomannomutase
MMSYPNLRENIKCPDSVKFKVIENLKKDYEKEGNKIDLTDGIRVIVNEGWGLVRPSNTEPLIRITVEGRTDDSSKRLLSKFKGDVMNAIRKLNN